MSGKVKLDAIGVGEIELSPKDISAVLEATAPWPRAGAKANIRTFSGFDYQVKQSVSEVGKLMQEAFNNEN